MQASVILNLITGFLKPTESIAVWILAIILGYNSYQLNNLTQELGSGTHIAQTQHALNVLKYAFKDAVTDDDFVELVKKWHLENRPAQIGAVETVCG